MHFNYVIRTLLFVYLDTSLLFSLVFLFKEREVIHHFLSTVQEPTRHLHKSQ